MATRPSLNMVWSSASTILTGVPIVPLSVPGSLGSTRVPLCVEAFSSTDLDPERGLLHRWRHPVRHDRVGSRAPGLPGRAIRRGEQRHLRPGAESFEEEGERLPVEERLGGYDDSYCLQKLLPS